MKKTTKIFVLIILFTLALQPQAFYGEEGCPFCDPEVLRRQAFYEDEFVFALYTHKPIFPGHCLVVPKRHVERFELLKGEEIQEIGLTLQKVDKAVTKVFGTSAYLLWQKNGVEVGQSVPHLHFHYIPRQAGDSSSLRFIVKMYMANIKSPMTQEEMNPIIEELKQNMP